MAQECECGIVNTDVAVRCECGRELHKIPARNATLAEALERTEPTAAMVTCPKCHKENDPRWRACDACGATMPGHRQRRVFEDSAAESQQHASPTGGHAAAQLAAQGRGWLLGGWLTLGIVVTWLQSFGATSQLVSRLRHDEPDAWIFCTALVLAGTMHVALVLTYLWRPQGVTLYHWTAATACVVALLTFNSVGAAPILAGLTGWLIFWLLVRRARAHFGPEQRAHCTPPSSVLPWSLTSALLIGGAVGMALPESSRGASGPHTSGGRRPLSDEVLQEELLKPPPVSGNHPIRMRAPDGSEGTVPERNLRAALDAGFQRLDTSAGEQLGAPPGTETKAVAPIAFRATANQGLGELAVHIVNLSDVPIDAVGFDAWLYDEFGTAFGKVSFSTGVVPRPIRSAERKWVSIPVLPNALAIARIQSAPRTVLVATKAHFVDGTLWTGAATTKDASVKPGARTGRRQPTVGAPAE